jgi:VIT1/CCC1 family predicted Fe2+/Mn2+ transporter
LPRQPEARLKTLKINCFLQNIDQWYDFLMKSRSVYKHNERHYVSRTGWLRAAVLGANDGIISVSSLVIGVASASADSTSILITGVAGLLQEPCQWQQVNMFRSARNPILKKPI